MRPPITAADRIAIALGEVDPDEFSGSTNGDGDHGGDGDGEGHGHDYFDDPEPPPDDEDEADDDASWYTPVDMTGVLAGTIAQPQPDVLTMADGRGHLFYTGMVNGLHGDSGSCKTWIAQIAAAQQIRAGRSVVVLDFESSRDEWAGRLVALGLDREAIARLLIYLNPSAPAMPEGKRPKQPHQSIRRLVELIKARGDVGLVVIDSVGEAFGLEGIDENADKEVGPWFRWVVRPLADTGPAVVPLDHSTKANDNPLHPSGSKRKRAAITGASYLVSSKTPPTKTSIGWVDMTCAKDRHGNYRRGEQVAVLELRPDGHGGEKAVLRRREPEEQGTTRNVALQRLVVEVVDIVKAAERPVSGRAVVEKIAIKARDQAKWAALDEAIAEGYIAQKKTGNANLHTFLKDVPEGVPE